MAVRSLRYDFRMRQDHTAVPACEPASGGGEHRTSEMRGANTLAQDTHALPGTLEPNHAHPGERTYIKIAVFLAAITVFEVVIYYLESAGSILVPALLLLSAIKFVTVVAYFMHLKFDDRRLSWVFSFGFLLAAAVFIAVVVMHNYDHVIEFVGDRITR